MVNIPPIPPLLCSTPPPIDFGEDDEDVDVLPSALVDCEHDDFGDFLVEDDIKSNEPLPSPRPPSVCDLPPISIYDGLIPPDEEDLTRSRIITSADDKTTEYAKNNTPNVTEAYNFNVKNINSETTNCLQDDTASCKQKSFEIGNEFKTLEDNSEVESNKPAPFSQAVCSEDLKSATDLKIETEHKSNKSNNFSLHSMVSIEDIENDLSDDELYSPKMPKNFTETDNIDNYFKIEEIKTNIAGNETNVDPKNVNTKCSDSLDNNETASFENENDNEFQSFSSGNSLTQNKFEMAPPLRDETNSTDDDDDFGEFADFQKTHFVYNTVPINNFNITHQNDTQTNDLNDFSKYNTSEESINTAKIFAREKRNSIVCDINESENVERSEDSENLNKKFGDLTCSSPTVTGSFQIKYADKAKYDSLDLQVIPQEIPVDEMEFPLTAKFAEDKLSTNESQMPKKEFCAEESNFSDFNSAPQINDKEIGKFVESSNPPLDWGNTNVKVTENIDIPTKYSNDMPNDEDEFDDFANFESHQEVIRSEEENHHSCKNEEGDDDDDFGDFNTADPISATASSPVSTITSQNITTETTALAPANLNERISKILQLMFSSAISPAEKTSYEPETRKIQDIPFTSIDAAKALEYQWLISETRHSFIRSLGIDSRNILYGENWNPSLPRFAANLSFNPLKPMKPVQLASFTGETTSILEPIPINNSEADKNLQISGSAKKESLDLDWESSNDTEQTIKAFKDNVTQSSASTAAIPYISSGLPKTEPESLTMFEGSLDNKEKFSKTPPISEMESVTTLPSTLPADTLNMELGTAQIELDENIRDTLSVNEVVVTSTYTGSFKETHIYTPPPANDFENKLAIATMSSSSSSPAKASPVDFDYEKAAMGVIIDETVVKKEYRDVEYNPPFTMESLSKSGTCKMEKFETNNFVNTNANILSSPDINAAEPDDQESNDDFSDFQSVSSDVATPTPATVPKTTKPLDVPKSTTVSHGGMILSPAILIPQAISLENQKPKIEWGDSTANINPEELARIEELFPEPKSLKSSGSNSSQKSTPTHQVVHTPSISATVATKELEGNINNINDDDEDWSDFVSVTVTNNVSTNKMVSNNNILHKSPASSFQQRPALVVHRMPPTTLSNSNNDDEWSEFVSSAPPIQQSNAYRVPQFNSGAWQNANFYNNPLSMYHKGPLNIPTPSLATHSAQKYLYNNNNNCNISQQPYQIANNIPPAMLASNQQTPNNAYQQQIHIMQNFSTAPVPTPERLSAAAAAAKNNQFQSIGSAKVAPSIALIPDLGFVAPAIPTHTSFINSLPKPSINMKK